MLTKVDKHKRICKELNELYARKNADYDDSFGKSFTEYGLTMACIRLEDKFNRIKALTKQTAQVSDESIADTLMDLANYSIMTLVELAQDEPKNGEHDPWCMIGCLCTSCVHDCGEEKTACCSKHGCDKCYVTECPDYVKEDPS